MRIMSSGGDRNRTSEGFNTSKSSLAKLLHEMVMNTLLGDSVEKVFGLKTYFFIIHSWWRGTCRAL